MGSFRRRTLAAALLAVAPWTLTSPLAWGEPTVAQAPVAPLRPGAFPPASASELADTRAEFLEDALRTLSDRSGDLFFLPAKYNFLSPNDRTKPTHVKVDGVVHELHTPGISHGVPWSYDRDIPLVMWGPGFIKPGQVVKRRTSQQDLTPTLAQLIGSPLPTHAKGSVLREALLPTKRQPKVILTVLFDQGGEYYYKSHPGATPFIDRLKREGTYFANTRVSHLDMETAMGHVAVGTGAFPMDHGLSSNEFWHDGHDDAVYTFFGPDGSAPYFMMSPTLGDTWLQASRNRAHLLSYCYADRAAMGMGGHGSWFGQNKKPWVYFLDTASGQLTAPPRHYELPAGLPDTPLMQMASRIAGPDGTWMGHPLKQPKDLLATPALAPWEGAQLRAALANSPIGEDDVPDLMYVTFKSTDAAGHQYGEESEECGAILAAQDEQFRLLVEALVAKVGAENVVVNLCADHGGPPLPELSGGKRLLETKLVNDLNARFDRTDDTFPIVQFTGGTQLWIDESQLVANHVTLDDLKRYLLAYRVDGKPFFDSAYTRRELDAIRAAREAAPAAKPSAPSPAKGAGAKR